MGFGMGWQEIAIIVVVAVIIFGPDKLPELAGQAGKLMRDFRRMTQDMTGEFEKQTGVSVKDLKQNVDKEIAGIKAEMAGTTASVSKEINSVKSSVSKSAGSVGKSVTSATGKKTGSASKTAANSKTATGASSSSSVSSAKSTSSKSTKTETPAPPKASKNDPLADVSFLDNAGDASSNGAAKQVDATTAPEAALVGAGAPGNPNDVPAERADALARARSRRQSAGYNQHPSNPN